MAENGQAGRLRAQKTSSPREAAAGTIRLHEGYLERWLVRLFLPALLRPYVPGHSESVSSAYGAFPTQLPRASVPGNRADIFAQRRIFMRPLPPKHGISALSGGRFRLRVTRANKDAGPRSTHVRAAQKNPSKRSPQYWILRFAV